MNAVIVAAALVDAGLTVFPVPRVSRGKVSKTDLLSAEFEDVDVPSLLGPKLCELCGGNPMKRLDLVYCPKCKLGKVYQRVAIVVERPCKTCDEEGEVGGDPCGGWPSSTCGGSGFRLVVEQTARVDDIKPIVHSEAYTADCIAVFRSGEHVEPGKHMERYDHGRWTSLDHLLLLADWSPGGWAVFVSDVQPYYNIKSDRPRRFVRPFAGITELDEMLA